ncbi:MAG: hypothetical protein N2109_12750 [Fimbriimonadales bacterium]|nr:hypothetical protein [Fimbriimonadales bacterium]
MSDARGIEGGERAVIALDWSAMPPSDAGLLDGLIAEHGLQRSYWNDPKTGSVIVALTIEARMFPEFRRLHSQYGVWIPGVSVRRQI